jgi:hypothetical protein
MYFLRYSGRHATHKIDICTFQCYYCSKCRGRMTESGVQLLAKSANFSGSTPSLWQSAPIMLLPSGEIPGAHARNTTEEGR